MLMFVKERSYKNSLLSGIYDGFRGQEHKRKGESFLIPIAEWFGHFVGELIELLSLLSLWKSREVRTAVHWFSRK